MPNERPEDPQSIPLRCCQDTPAPPAVLEGWKCFLRLPKGGVENIWDVLAPALLQPANPNTKTMVEAFCREHAIEEAVLIAALNGCGFLIERASALDLGIEAFREDIGALSDGDSGREEVVLARYDAIKARLRKGIIQQSLADHGKVLVGLDWRLDTVSASDRGAQLNTTVVFLTLRYLEGSETQRITLQLTPDALRDLKLFMQRFGE